MMKVWGKDNNIVDTIKSMKNKKTTKSLGVVFKEATVNIEKIEDNLLRGSLTGSEVSATLSIRAREEGDYTCQPDNWGW